MKGREDAIFSISASLLAQMSTQAFSMAHPISNMIRALLSREKRSEEIAFEATQLLERGIHFLSKMRVIFVLHSLDKGNSSLIALSLRRL
jgi:hypothetical protein